MQYIKCIFIACIYGVCINLLVPVQVMVACYCILMYQISTSLLILNHTHMDRVNLFVRGLNPVLMIKDHIVVFSL